MSRFAEKSCTRLTYWLRKWLHIRLVSIVQVCVNVFAHVCVCVPLNTHFKFDRILSDAFSSQHCCFCHFRAAVRSICAVNRLHLLYFKWQRTNSMYFSNAMRFNSKRTHKKKVTLKRFYRCGHLKIEIHIDAVDVFCLVLFCLFDLSVSFTLLDTKLIIVIKLWIILLCCELP